MAESPHPTQLQIAQYQIQQATGKGGLEAEATVLDTCLRLFGLRRRSKGAPRIAQIGETESAGHNKRAKPKRRRRFALPADCKNLASPFEKTFASAHVLYFN